MKRRREKCILSAFGNHLIKLRKNAGFSQKDFAYETDLEISQIYRIEKGKVDASLSTIVKLANALNLTLSELLNFDTPEK